MKVSEHAIDKYMEVCNSLYGRVTNDRDIIRDRILDMFAYAKKEDAHAGLIKRMINHKCCDTEYYKDGFWRFVVCDETIVTLERDVFGKIQPYDPKHTRKGRRRLRLHQKRVRKMKRREKRNATNSKCFN
jgi:hypothetical protein